MRKFMTKEVTKTTVKIAQIEQGANGLPVANVLEDVILIGNVSLEKAQKEMGKRFEFPVTVFGVEPSTEIYKLSVEDFLQHATLVTPDEVAQVEAEEVEEKEAPPQA